MGTFDSDVKAAVAKKTAAKWIAQAAHFRYEAQRIEDDGKSGRFGAMVWEREAKCATKRAEEAEAKAKEWLQQADAD